MPLGIVTDEEFNQELEQIIHKPINHGRGHKQEIPEVVREIIAEEAIISDNSQKEIASAFGVSESSVSAYKNGATSTATYNEPDKKLQKHTDKIRSAIVRTARSRLIEALQNITPDKMREAKLRDIASVAKDMSSVIHNIEPQISNQQVGAQFIFHVPKPRSESDYDIIDVTQ